MYAPHSQVLLANVAIWVDFACIDQDDRVLQTKGINSLLTYAARSSFVLIPVGGHQLMMRAFAEAEHPSELVQYGERAWCRLESYIFLCLGEITNNVKDCFGYGPILHNSSFACLGLGSANGTKEVLRALNDKAVGATFTRAEMPSSGELTVEDDRELIRSIEDDVRNDYIAFVFQSEVSRFAREHPEEPEHKSNSRRALRSLSGSESSSRSSRTLGIRNQSSSGQDSNDGGERGVMSSPSGQSSRSRLMSRVASGSGLGLGPRGSRGSADLKAHGFERCSSPEEVAEREIKRIFGTSARASSEHGLQLSGKQLNTGDIPLLASTIAENEFVKGKVRALHIGGNHFVESDVTPIMRDVIKGRDPFNLSMIGVLDLSNIANLMKSHGLVKLLQWLPQTSIHTLDISGCGLRDSGLKLLAKKFGQRTLISLIRLNISNSELKVDDEAISLIYDLSTALYSNIKRILGPDGVERAGQPFEFAGSGFDLSVHRNVDLIFVYDQSKEDILALSSSNKDNANKEVTRLATSFKN